MDRKLAIVLPGRGYTAFGPTIRIPVLALEEAGYTVRDVTYPNVPDHSDDFPWMEFSEQTAEHIAAAAKGTWDQTVVVAKSLGTGALAHAGATLDLPRPRAIWLTPLFFDAEIAQRAMDLGWPALLVAGTADRAHDPEQHDRVAASLSADSLLIDGADHGLEIPGDVAATVAGFARLADATLDFVA